MNDQEIYWEKEYKEPKFLSLATEASLGVTRFKKWLTHEEDVEINGKEVIDLGCGNGRHSKLFGELGAHVVGVDFSGIAIDYAKKHNGDRNVEYRKIAIVDFLKELPDASVDISIDCMASLSLYDGEREDYIEHLARVLKPGGYAYIRTFVMDGDRNAKNLIEMFKGPEPDSYIHPDTFIVEHVVTERKFKELYGEHFEIPFLKKMTGYQRWGGQSYKRRYVEGYLKKK